MKYRARICGRKSVNWGIDAMKNKACTVIFEPVYFWKVCIGRVNKGTRNSIQCDHCMVVINRTPFGEALTLPSLYFYPLI